MKKTIAVDFDGVIHKYSKGWQGGEIYDEPIEGVKEALGKLVEKNFKVVILTTRLNPDILKSDANVRAKRFQIVQWLRKYGMEEGKHYHELTGCKPAAIVYLDDRGIRFEGNWKSILKYFC